MRDAIAARNIEPVNPGATPSAGPGVV
jgi:hypothetical protein